MSHSLRYEVNCSMLFTELPLLQRPAAAARRPGSTPSSSGGRSPPRCRRDAEVDEFVAAISDAGVQLIGLNFFAGDMPGGDRGLVSWPARSSEFRDNIDVTVGIGERLGCRRSTPSTATGSTAHAAEEQDELAAENLWPPRGPPPASAAPCCSSRSAAPGRTRCAPPPTRPR